MNTAKNDDILVLLLSQTPLKKSAIIEPIFYNKAFFAVLNSVIKKKGGMPCT